MNANARTSHANPWNADIVVTPELVARRIGRQFPELLPVMVEPLGEGWDNVAYVVNGNFVFRFPRRGIAIPFLENEARVLPHLARLLPLPVPDVRFVGVADEEDASPFVGYLMLSGTTACRMTWTDEQRAAVAGPLGAALRVLHSIPTDSEWARSAPVDTIRRADTGYQAVRLRERLGKLSPMVDASELAAVAVTIDRLADTPLYEGELRLLHGDLYVRHLLVDGAHRLCGLIDWGDLHRGDPALDLSIVFSFLPATGDVRAEFRAAYGAVDEATWDRARFRALNYGVILSLYGIDMGDAAIREAGFYALRAGWKE